MYVLRQLSVRKTIHKRSYNSILSHSVNKTKNPQGCVTLGLYKKRVRLFTEMEFICRNGHENAEMDYLYKLDIKFVNVKELFYNIYHNFLGILKASIVITTASHFHF